MTILGTIALARLLTPEDFGLFAVVTFGVVLVMLFGDVGVGAALIQQQTPPTDRELGTAFAVQLAIWSAVVTAVFAAAAVAPVVVTGVPAEGLTLARLLAVSAWFNGMRSVPSVMLTRVLRFGPLAVIEIVQQVVYFGVAVGAAALGYGVVTFGIAAVIQAVVATTATWLVFGRWPRIAFDGAAARRLWRFGIGFQLSYTLYWARDSVVAVFGGLAGGLQGVGYLQFGWRNGQFAITIEDVVARAAFPAFSRLQADPRQLAVIAVTAIEAGFLGIVVIQGWLAATAPSLVPLVFSEKWVPATTIFQLICIGSVAWGPVIILRALIYATGESGRVVRLAALNLVVLYVVFPPLTLAAGLAGAGLAFGISVAIALATHAQATNDVIPFPWRSAVRFTAETMVAAAAAAAVVSVVPGWLGLAASLVAYCTVMVILLAALERSLMHRARGLLGARGASVADAGALP